MIIFGSVYPCDDPAQYALSGRVTVLLPSAKPSAFAEGVVKLLRPPASPLPLSPLYSHEAKPIAVRFDGALYAPAYAVRVKPCLRKLEALKSGPDQEAYARSLKETCDKLRAAFGPP